MQEVKDERWHRMAQKVEHSWCNWLYEFYRPPTVGLNMVKLPDKSEYLCYMP